MKLSRTSLGLAVRAARKAANMTAESLSEASGIDRSALSRTENGLRSLEFSEAVTIAAILNIDVESLRTLAETFEREGAPAKRENQREIEVDLNRLQRAVVQAAIELSQG